MEPECRTITVRNNRFDDCDGENLATAQPLTVPSGTEITFNFVQGFHTAITVSNTTGGPDIRITGPGGGDTDAVLPTPQERKVTVSGTPGGEIRFECGIHGASMN